NLIADIEKCGHGALGHGWQLWPLSRAGMRMKTTVPCSTDCAKEPTDERSLWRFFETGYGFEWRVEHTSRLTPARTRRTPACARGCQSRWRPSLGSARARRACVRARLRARLAGSGRGLHGWLVGRRRSGWFLFPRAGCASRRTPEKFRHAARAPAGALHQPAARPARIQDRQGALRPRQRPVLGDAGQAAGVFLRLL